MSKASFVPGLTTRELTDGLRELQDSFRAGTISEHAPMATKPEWTIAQFATWVTIHIHAARQRKTPEQKLMQQHSEYARRWNKIRGINDDDERGSDDE